MSTRSGTGEQLPIPADASMPPEAKDRVEQET